MRHTALNRNRKEVRQREWKRQSPEGFRGKTDVGTWETKSPAAVCHWWILKDQCWQKNVRRLSWSSAAFSLSNQWRPWRSGINRRRNELSTQNHDTLSQRHNYKSLLTLTCLQFMAEDSHHWSEVMMAGFQCLQTVRPNKPPTTNLTLWKLLGVNCRRETDRRTDARPLHYALR